MEDQSVEVIGQVSQGQFCLGPLDADGADGQPEPIFLVRKHISILARIADFAALAWAVALDIGLPLGLRRWMRLVSMRSASHASFALEP
jgi:hypothetical protein